MYREEYYAVVDSAVKKAKCMDKAPLSFFLLSVMAGMFIGIGAIFMGFVGGCMMGQPYQKFISGIVFSIGLCLVTVAGAELFTGNNFIMAVGGMTRTIPWAKVVKSWIICYVGNLIGSVITTAIFTMTGIPGSGDVGEFFANSAVAKVQGTPASLFSKAIFCNIMVCLAVWCAKKLKSEGAKLLMNFCCVAMFVTCGFEHSVGNMTSLTVGLMNGADITIGGCLYNLGIVTLGNMVGGILFVALPYYLITKDDKDDETEAK